MHGETIKIINAKQAKLNNYKNTKYRLLRTNAAIWYKMCRMKEVKPGYIHVKIKGGRQRDNNRATNQAIRYKINQELKFLYKKKQHINKTLYSIHLECAHHLNVMWPSIQCNIDDKLRKKMEIIYMKLNKTLDLTQDTPKYHGNTRRTYNPTRVINLSNVNFTGEQLKTFEPRTTIRYRKGTKTLHKPPNSRH